MTTPPKAKPNPLVDYPGSIYRGAPPAVGTDKAVLQNARKAGNEAVIVEARLIAERLKAARVAERLKAARAHLEEVGGHVTSASALASPAPAMGAGLGSAPTAKVVGAPAAAAERVIKRELDILPALVAEKALQQEQANQIVGLLFSLKNVLSALRTSTTDRATNQAIATETIREIISRNPELCALLASSINNALGTTQTPETLQEYLIANNSVFLTVTDEIGTPLIDILLGQSKAQLEQIKNLSILYKLKKELKTTPFNATETLKLFNALNGDIKGNLAWLVWNNCGKARDGMQMILENPFVLISSTSTDSTSPLDTLISQAESLTAADRSPIALAKRVPVGRERTFSEDFFQSRITINQLTKLNELLSTSTVGKDEICKFFDRLPTDVRELLCEIVWRVDGQIDRLNYGLETIQNHPWILLSLRNEDGQNIIEQLIAHENQVYLSKVVHDHMLAIRSTITPELNIEACRAAFAALHDKFPELAREIGKRVWQRDRVRAAEGHNPNFGGFGYGDRILAENPATLLEVAHGETTSIMLGFLDEMQRIIGARLLETIRSPEKSSTSTERLATRVDTAAVRRIAMITAEFKDIVSEGGLGEAVRGMAEGLGGRNVSIIMPKYDVIPIEGMERTAYTVDGHAVFRKMVGDIECFLIEDHALFTVGNTGTKANSIYGGAFANGHDAHIKARFAHFQKYATDLALQFYREISEDGTRKIDVVHVHDSQMALVPRIYAELHSEAWKAGETPPVVFTYHNNLPGSQGRYEYEEAIASTRTIGLGDSPVNSFIEGLSTADACTTVSATFAKESSSEGILARGVGSSVRKAIYDGKLFDVLNGNTVGWNPKTNPVLKNWTTVDSIDLPEDAEQVKIDLIFDLDEATTPEEQQALIGHYIGYYATQISVAERSGQKVVLDLTYGPKDHPLVIAFKKQLCKEQVQAYLAKYRLGSIAIDRPLLLNLGRFDPSQKGIDKLPFIMDKALEAGAQMICIGLDGEKCPDDMRNLHAISRHHSGLGAVVIEDERLVIEKDGRKINKIKWQTGHLGADGREIPGIGPLLRAAADICVFPSEFEPCGLVQGESFLFGDRVLATRTGGFADTVITEGDRKNGWLFRRHEHWHGQEQLDSILATLQASIAETRHALYSGDEAAKTAFYAQSARIMGEALRSSWTETPDGSASAVEKLKRVYAFAKERAKQRGVFHVDILNPRNVIVLG